MAGNLNMRWVIAVGLIAWSGTACSLDNLLKSDQIPRGITDPALTETPQGALAIYNGTIATFRDGFGSSAGPAFVTLTGLLSDELQSGRDLGGPSVNAVDARLLPELNGDGAGGAYSSFQQTRAQAAQAIELLTRYAPEDRALAGHMYALEGYAEMLLAEYFCSGIPLTTLDYGGDYTLKPGSSTTDVLQHALALFDTATTLVGDSTRFVHLTAIGKARALLDLGEYSAAAAAVTAVPDTFHYNIVYTAVTGAFANNFATQTTGGLLWSYSVANQEGVNGLDYISSSDPRTTVTSAGTNAYGYSVYSPAKYATDGSSPIVLASGVEARLVQAEAALQASDATTWLAILNQLRTTGVSTPDTIADTLGVTGCGAGVVCGTSPGGNTPDMGQPPGGFRVPFGYSLASVDTASPTPAGIQDYCNSYSWYEPCYSGDSLVVYVYAGAKWEAGTGKVAGLPPLSDPGTLSGRVDLMFRERAFWLFLTGHRQGDLRRLIRQYGRTEDTVYPTGPYPTSSGAYYGGDVTAPLPSTEREYNPQYTGCITRDA